MIVVSIDPGIRGCGVAVWINGVLQIAAYVPNSSKSGAGPAECVEMALAIKVWLALYAIPRVDVLVVEWPQMYGGRASRGDSNDLLPLTGVDCAIAALHPNAAVHHYVPHSWKGSIEKPKKAADPYPIEERVKKKLTPEENSRVHWPKSEKHGWDVSDGLGVGLKFLGRFERHRVYACD